MSERLAIGRTKDDYDGQEHEEQPIEAGQSEPDMISPQHDAFDAPIINQE